MIPKLDAKIAARLLAGDKTVVDTVILHYLPLAKKIAKYFARKYVGREDDIHGASRLGLVYSVHRIANGQMFTENITCYINNTIREHIIRAVMEDHLIVIPKYKYLEFVEKGKIFELLPVVNYIRPNGEDVENPDVGYMLEPEAPAECDLTILAEFYESLSDIEKQVLELRMDGKNMQQIAEALGYAQAHWTWTVIEEIRRKFRGWKGDEWPAANEEGGRRCGRDVSDAVQESDS